jgi:hypothetical protein
MLLTVDAPASSASSCSSAEGLAPGEMGYDYIIMFYRSGGRTDIHIALFNYNHLTIDFIGDAVHFFPGFKCLVDMIRLER